MINLYQIQKDQIRSVTLPDMSSLDAITRQLPEGYYSTFRTYDGSARVLGLSSHLQRLPDVDASLLRRQLLLSSALNLLDPLRDARRFTRTADPSTAHLPPRRA